MPNDQGTPIPFGMHKGSVIEELPDHYLKWLTYQDWLENKHPTLMGKIEGELVWRKMHDEHID